MPGSRDRVLASMGIYVFDTRTLVGELARDATDAASSHDFGADVVPGLLHRGRRVFAHSFAGSCVRATGQTPYWRDVGTIDAYWEANLELTRTGPALDLFDPAWPLSSTPDRAMPTRFLVDEKGRYPVIKASLAGSGCIIGAAEIDRSVLFSDLQVHDGACVEESLLLPQVDVARGVRLRRVIVDSYCRLPAGLVAGFDAGEDRRRFHVTPRGITLITPEMLGQRAAARRG
jgi:glucose-1-phosphate adenylyltransferase